MQAVTVRYIVDDVEAAAHFYEDLLGFDAGVGIRSEIIEGRGGRQVVIDDPSGNPVELFQPA